MYVRTKSKLKKTFTHSHTHGCIGILIDGRISAIDRLVNYFLRLHYNMIETCIRECSLMHDGIDRGFRNLKYKTCCFATGIEMQWTLS